VTTLLALGCLSGWPAPLVWGTFRRDACFQALSFPHRQVRVRVQYSESSHVVDHRITRKLKYPAQDVRRCVSPLNPRDEILVVRPRPFGESPEGGRKVVGKCEVRLVFQGEISQSDVRRQIARRSARSDLARRSARGSAPAGEHGAGR
jgi:hypothetical protein